MKIKLKPLIPYAIAIGLFLLLTVAFYHPIFLNNKTLAQNDIIQGISAGQEIKDFRAETGEEALWTNSMFGGMPAYLINMSWSDDLITFLVDACTLWMDVNPQVTFISFISFFILLTVFGVRPYLAIAGAICFGLSTFSIISIEAGHIWKVRAIAYMPMVLAGIHILYKSPKKWRGVALLALAFALEVKSNHLQITYYLALLLSCYGVNELVQAFKNKTLPDFAKNSGLVLFAILLGVAINFGRLWTTIEYGTYSTRGASNLTSSVSPSDHQSGLEKDYVFRWSHGIAESFTLLIPNFYGGASIGSLDKNSNLANALSRQGLSQVQIKNQISRLPLYHGEQPGVAGPIYVGAIVCFLFLIGVLFTGKHQWVWMVVATVLSLFLAWGKNLEWFNYLMFDFFPGYDKFRSVSMAIVISNITIPLLGFIGFEQLLTRNSILGEDKKKFLIALSGTAGLALLFIITAGMFNYSSSLDSQMGNVPDWFINALQQDRKSLMRTDAIRSIVLTLLFATIIYFFIRRRINPGVFYTLAISLLVFDFWFVDRRYINDENFVSEKNIELPKTAADQRILSDKDIHYRVLNLQDPWNDARTSYYHSSIGGYHGAKLKRYQEFIEHSLNNDLQSIINGLQSQDLKSASYYSVNMLNTKYFKFGDQQNQVVRNPEAFGNAWLVSDVIAVQNSDEEIEETNNLTLKNEAVINTEEFDISNTYGSSGSISLVEYQPNYLKYDFTGDQNSLVVFSEVYYPEGWVATIDDQEVPLLRANYILRAIEVPAGNHSVELSFKPKSYSVGDAVTKVSSILLFLFLGIALFMEYKDKKDEQA